MENNPPPQEQDLPDRAGVDQLPCHSATASDSLLMQDWFTPPRFALLLGILIVATFPKVIRGLQSFIVRDFGFFAYPLAHFQKECFWRGELPLWNPYNNCGVPFLAQWNTMCLYPPALIYLLAPLSWSLSFFSLAHLFFAGLGMYFLAHRWSASRMAAAFAGLVFAFNGLSLNMLMWPSHIATLAWMPWVVLTVEQGWQKGGRMLVAAVLSGAMQMLAGGPETIMLTWIWLLALWLVQAFQGVRGAGPVPGNDGKTRAILWRFPCIVFLVAALAAAQLLPFLDLVAHSQRQEGYADTRWSMPGWGWANFLVPMVFGQIWNIGVFFQYEQAWTSSYYLGIGVVLLAPLGLLRWRDSRVRLLALTVILGLFLALGEQTFLYTWLRALVPQLSLITYPIKFVTLVIFAAPLLMAFSLARVDQSQSANGKDISLRLFGFTVILLVCIGAILVWAKRFPFPGDNLALTVRSGVTRGLFLITITLLLWKFCRTGNVALRRLLPLVLVLIFWLDLRTQAPSQNPTAPPGVFTPGLARAKLAMQPQPELGVSRAMVSPFAAAKFISFASSSAQNNFLVKRLGYFADCNLLDGVPKTDGFFSLYPRHCGELNLLLYGSTNADYPHLQDFLAVSQVTAPGEFVEWKPRSSCLPMVTAGQQPVFVDETNSLRLLCSRDFQPAEVVLLPAESEHLVVAKARTTAQVISSRFQPHLVEVEAAGADPFLVVIAQSFYHRWRAYVDGRPVPLLRANYGFQAIQVPAGRHRLEIRYHDTPLYCGAAVSGLAVLWCVVGWFLAGKNRRCAQIGQKFL